MSLDFTTRLQLQLREAALREERRSPLGRRLAGLRHGRPGPAVVTAVALAAALVVAIVVAGGVRWGGERPVAHPNVVANFALADNLGSLASGFGSVWVADTKNLEVLRVEPRTHAVSARIRTGGDTSANGGDPIVNAGAGAVWAIARAPSSDGGHRVLRIDPKANDVTATVPLPAAQAPIVYDIQIVEGRPWVLTTAGAIGLDPATGRPETFVKVRKPAGDPGPIWSTISDGRLWVITRDGTVDGYDLASGRRVESKPLPVAGAGLLAPTSEGGLYGFGNGELALAGEDGKVAWQHRLSSTPALPYVTGGTVWVFASDIAGGRDRLIELDLRSGKVRSSTGLPEFGIAGITSVGDDLWLTSQNGRVTIVRPPED
jgi:hypothetical protein